MEMGSGSMGFSGASGSNDSLNGLKFGKKIYFEDVGGGSSSSKGTVVPTSAPLVPPVAPRRGRSVAQGGGQPHPPRCQVEGCKMDLTGAKPYYCRHKVCGMHSKSPKVIVAGLEQRFCQQCSRFHQLPEFDEGKRSCRRRLAGHNERRRKPPPGSLSSRYGRPSSSFYEDNSRYGGLLMDFAYPRLPGSARDIWPTARAGNRVGGNEWLGNLESHPSSRVVGQAAHPYVHRTVGDALFSNHEVPVSDCLGITDSSCALSLLSNQTWEPTTTTRSRAPTISANSNFEGNQMAHPTMATSYPSSSWGFKGLEASSNSHELPREMMGLGQVDSGNDQFYGGELELALQGNKQCMELGHGRSYAPSGHLMHWSL